MLIKYLKRLKWYTLVNIHKYKIIPYSKMNRVFMLSDKEFIEAQKIYKEKGNIEYHFCPCGGIGIEVKVKVVKTGEIIDITDTTCW